MGRLLHPDERTQAFPVAPIHQAYIAGTRRRNPIRDRLIPADLMRQTGSIGTTCIWAGAVALLATGMATVRAQGPENARTAQALFTALDPDKDGTLTRPELESGFDSWFTAWNDTHSGTLTQPEIVAGISKVLP